MGKPRLLIIGPVPPPIHGVTISTTLVLANERLHDHFDVTHIDTSDHRTTTNLGRWEIQNVTIALRALGRLLGALRGRRGIVYVPFSQGVPALLRDYLYAWAAVAFRWRIAGHLRGGEIDDVVSSAPRWFQFVTRLTFRRVESMAVMSEGLRHIFDDLMPPERIAVVGNGTPDPHPFPLADDDSTVLFLSNLWRRKGFLESVAAATRVIDAVPEARFFFAGAFEDEAVREEALRLAQNRPEIVFSEPISGEDKRAALLKAAVFLFPPREPEGHPRALLEAMAAGRAIVTTSRGAIADTVDQGRCAVLLDQPEPELLAQHVERLLRDRSARMALGSAARARYEAAYTQEHADMSFSLWLENLWSMRS
jgi:glycosyltransferase involved in cell wall biosynthesis